MYSNGVSEDGSGSFGCVCVRDRKNVLEIEMRKRKLWFLAFLPIPGLRVIPSVHHIQTMTNF